MPFERQPPLPGEIIESSTDPAGDSTYRVTSESKWLDISQTPAVFYQRNADNTDWDTLAGSAGTPLGSYTDTYTITTGQTTAVLTYTPVSLADIQAFIGPLAQDPTNLTNLTAKTVTFTAMPAAANGKTLLLHYTRLD